MQFLSCLDGTIRDEAFQHHINCSWSILIFWISIVTIHKLFGKVTIQYKNTVAPSNFSILIYNSFAWECVRYCLRCLDQNKKVVLKLVFVALFLLSFLFCCFPRDIAIYYAITFNENTYDTNTLLLNCILTKLHCQIDKS